LAFTFGMVFPLFVMALLWDRYHLGDRAFLKARPVRLHLGAHILATNTVNLVVAGMFTIMGFFVIYLAGSGEMTSGPGFQVAFGKKVAQTFAWVEKFTSPVPEAFLGLFVLALAGVFVYFTLRDRPAKGEYRGPADDLTDDDGSGDGPDSPDALSSHENIERTSTHK